jgi:hypothetical protein
MPSVAPGVRHPELLAAEGGGADGAGTGGRAMVRIQGDAAGGRPGGLEGYWPRLWAPSEEPLVGAWSLDSAFGHD